MDNQLLFLTLDGYEAEAGTLLHEWRVSYQVFGQSIDTHPVVLVNHALTGNSDVANPNTGWWKEVVGAGKLIDTDKYAVVAFNIPGNGYDDVLVKEYQWLTARDIAQLFLLGLEQIGVTKLHAVIGGSLGGGIAWEMAVLKPNYIDVLIPVASDWKATDWMIGHNYVQESILENSKRPLHDARMMAMLFYRTPASLKSKFDRTKNLTKGRYNIETWLEHHGTKLEGRFALNAYRLMNHLLTSVDISRGRESSEAAFASITSTVVQVGVDTDLFFIPEENRRTQKVLDKIGIPNAYHEIQSPHGHDAFLIENQQLTQLLTPYF